jgi:predicted DCC family thiol-disulfide oxidoreductase YuxK
VNPLLVFDGECGFCTRALGWLRFADRRRVIETLPYQHPSAPERLGLDRGECAASVHWRGPDGTRAQGAEAINAALAVALDADWPLRLYRRTAALQNRLYQWVSEHRHRLPGITPWCARYPDQCARG